MIRGARKQGVGIFVLPTILRNQAQDFCLCHEGNNLNVCKKYSLIKVVQVHFV